MKDFVLKFLRWITIVVALTLSIDAVLAIYKTIEFRSGIEDRFDFFGTILICLSLFWVTTCTGLGALAGISERSYKFSEKSLLGVAVCVGVIFLLSNSFSFSEWIKQALISKSESVLVCVLLSSLLLLLTKKQKEEKT